MTIAFSFSCVPSLYFPFSIHLMRQLTGTVRGQDTKSSDKGPKSGTNRETVQRGVEQTSPLPLKITILPWRFCNASLGQNFAPANPSDSFKCFGRPISS